PATLELKVAVEDHSRNLKRLRSLRPGESNSAAARADALETHRSWLETEFRAEAGDRGLALAPGAPLRLELTVTSLGEVRAKYIAYGIASGVAWGVGTGLVAHDPRLAVGLGLYELIEESAFWIAGSAVFGAYSAPVVVEASVFDRTNPKALWKASYYILNGRKRLKALPEDQRSDRATQLHASLRGVLDKLFKDLESIPGFPRAAEPSRGLAPSAAAAKVAAAPR
ncbi:MAG: hypothetical protein KGN80_01160, partial [Acidobacteriota bacterium]|nr:hypothetical protein [Acidobacteriota bacterium]